MSIQRQPDETAITARELSWLCLILFGYFFLMLGSRALNVPDEGRYSDVAYEMLLSGDFITPRLDGVVFFHKPILFYWLQMVSLSLFGVSEWSVRLMPALFGVFGCVLTYITATLLYGRRAGLLAVIVLATNPLYYLSSHYANLDLEVAVLMSGALFSFMLGLRHPLGSRRRNLMWLAYAFAALAVLTKGLIGLVLPALAVGLWMVLRRQWTLLRRIYLPSGLLVFALIALPWYVAVQIRNPEFFHFFFIDQQFNRFTGGGFNNAQPGWFYLPILLIGFFPWITLFGAALWSTARHGLRVKDEHGFGLLLLAWIFVVTLFFSIPESKLIGYVLPVLPAMAVMTGVFIDRQLEAWPKLRRQLYAFGAVALVLAVALLIAPHFTPRRYAGEVLTLYTLTMAGVLLAGAALAAAASRLRSGLPALGAVGVTGGLMTLLLVSLVGQYPLHSIKPLALLVKPHLQPDDVVIAFNDFYHDLDLYMQPKQSVIVVHDWDRDDPAARRNKDNWESELRFGIDLHGRASWMIDDDDFGRSLWADRTVYVFARASDVEKLRVRYALTAVAEANGIGLLTNRPDRLTEGPAPAQDEGERRHDGQHQQQ